MTDARGGARACAGLLVIACFLSAGAFAGQLGFNGTFQYSRLAPRFGNTESYSLAPGIRYDDDGWYANAYLPVLYQSRDAMARMGQMTVPTGSGQASSGGMSGHMGTGGGMGGFHPAFGDFYVNGGYRILSEAPAFPAISLTAQLKAPTAMGGFGTGAWDLGAGVGFKKTFGSVLSFLDLSYLATGDPAGATYRDPLIFGLGAGPVFGDGLWSLLLYYLGSTPVLEGLPGQRQLSAGTNYRAAENLFLSVSLARGFSDSVPEISAAAGISVYRR